MPLNPNLSPEERAFAEALVLVGQLARFFKTPIPFFLDMNEKELEMWADVMEELNSREIKASEAAMKKGV